MSLFASSVGKYGFTLKSVAFRALATRSALPTNPVGTRLMSDAADKKEPKPKLTQLQLVERVFDAAVEESDDLSKKDTELVIKTLFKEISNALVDESTSVPLVGIGTLHSAIQKATTKRNPKTGDKIDVPEKRRIKFVVSQPMKKALNPEFFP